MSSGLARILIVVLLIGVGVALLARGPGIARLWTTASARQAACEQALALRRVRLLQAARVQYERIPKPGSGRTCPAISRGELDDLQRRRGYSMERAQTYRRAAVQVGGSETKLGRRLLRRARNAYLLALARDPYSPAARAALRRVIVSRRPPADRLTADRACALGRRLRMAGLLPEARVVYARALATGRSTRCVHSGIRRLRARRGLGLRRLQDARAHDAAGDVHAARRQYVLALATDTSLTAAARGLQDLPMVSGRWPMWMEDTAAWVSAAADRVARLAKDLTDKAAGIALALLAVGALALLAAAGVVSMCRMARVRRIVTGVPLVWRLSRTRVVLKSFEGADAAAAMSVAASFAAELRKPPLVLGDTTPGGAGGNIDCVSAAVATEAAPPDVQDLSAFPPAMGMAAVLRFLGSIVPRLEWQVLGQLMQEGREGVGLQIQLVRRRGQVGDLWTGWETDLRVARLPASEAYYALSIEAADWARGKLL